MAASRASCTREYNREYTIIPASIHENTSEQQRRNPPDLVQLLLQLADAGRVLGRHLVQLFLQHREPGVAGAPQRRLLRETLLGLLLPQIQTIG